ncbi:acyl carrier protein [Streptomyces sp. NPDC018610]|jgi:acyl carrier protein|uniref:acyl carrier protein n=1 Tax=Streptomyces sp. NPDC018610 TaxID=3365049 RepID=UPI0037B25789
MSDTAREEDLRRIAVIVAEITGLEEDEIRPDAELVDDLCIDSVARIELMVACESRLGVAMPDEVVNRLRTVDDVLDHFAAARTPAS